MSSEKSITIKMKGNFTNFGIAVMEASKGTGSFVLAVNMILVRMYQAVVRQGIESLGEGRL